MIYEVNCMVPELRRTEFLAWLELHVKQLMKLEGFEDATISCLEEDDRLPEAHVGFCVQYFLEDQQVFEKYLSDYAPPMREDGIRRFGEDLKVYRRLMSRPLFSS